MEKSGRRSSPIQFRLNGELRARFNADIRINQLAKEFVTMSLFGLQPQLHTYIVKAVTRTGMSFAQVCEQLQKHLDHLPVTRCTIAEYRKRGRRFLTSLESLRGNSCQS